MGPVVHKISSIPSEVRIRCCPLWKQTRGPWILTQACRLACVSIDPCGQRNDRQKTTRVAWARVETTWVEGGTSGRSIGCAEACRAAAAAARRAWCVNSTFAASDSAACKSKTLDA